MFLIITICCLCFSSWAYHDEQENDRELVVYNDYVSTYEFYMSAYNYRKRNNLPIPDEYYEELGIENPNTPAWVKTPATISVSTERVLELRKKVPEWVRKGILYTETNSYYLPDGTIKYVNKRRGYAGDIGPFQMRKIAFDEVKKAGERFYDLEKNPIFAEELACRYLLFIYEGKGNGDWNKTIMKYNSGPYNSTTPRATRYLTNVLRNSTKSYK